MMHDRIHSFDCPCRRCRPYASARRIAEFVATLLVTCLGVVALMGLWVILPA